MRRVFMKKYIAFCAVFAGLALGMNTMANAAIANRTFSADVEAIRIPEGTTLKLELMDGISSKTQFVGDEFSAMLKEDKKVNGRIALPAGTIIRGTLSSVKPARRLSRSAIVYLKFDHVVTPTGKQVPIGAGLYNYPELTVDGGIYQGGNYGYTVKQNWGTSKKILHNTIDWGKGTGNNLQYVCVPVGAFGGVLGGGGYSAGMDIANLFTKGNDVNLTQGKEFAV